MTVKRIFYRHRTTWAWGASSWEYHDIVISEDDWDNWEKDEIVPQIHREHDYSDKYRGVDIERVDTPPLDWLQEAARRSESAIRHYTQRLDDLRPLIEKAEAEPPSIIRFYRGGKHPDGYTRQDALDWPDERWETCHTAVQWLFPLPEPSKMQPDSPVATAEDFEAFRADSDLRGRLERAVYRFQDFLRRSDWVEPGNHNLLRITRVIRCLTLAGMETKAKVFHREVKRRVLAKLPDAETDPNWRRTLEFWAEALNEHPSWLETS